MNIKKTVETQGEVGDNPTSYRLFIDENTL